MHVGAIVVFLISKCTPRQHGNLLGGAEYTLVNWDHSLIDISQVFNDIRLKDMCQARELD